MKFILVIAVFFISTTWAKAPAHPESFFCPQKDRKSIEVRPVLLHQVSEKHVIGLCGTKDSQKGNYLNFDAYVFPETKKPIFSNHLKNRKFLAMEKKDGMLFVEKLKVDNEFVELFKTEIVCSDEKCKLENDTCIAINKVKQKWVFKNVKDPKIKSRMKKLGCA